MKLAAFLVIGILTVLLSATFTFLELLMFLPIGFCAGWGISDMTERW